MGVGTGTNVTPVPARVWRGSQKGASQLDAVTTAAEYRPGLGVGQMDQHLGHWPGFPGPCFQ